MRGGRSPTKTRAVSSQLFSSPGRVEFFVFELKSSRVELDLGSKWLINGEFSALVSLYEWKGFREALMRTSIYVYHVICSNISFRF